MGNPSMLFPKKSAPTLMTKLKKKPSPRPLPLPSKSKKRSKWSPSANPDTKDMVDTDTLMDTTTAKRLPKPPPTTSPLSPPSMSPSPLPTPPQHPLTQLPLPPTLKQSTLKIALPPNDPVILCRSIAQLKECFQDRNYLSIFILLFMPSKISLHTG